MPNETPQPPSSIPVERTTAPRPRVPDAELGFGRVFTDHLLRLDWTEAGGWHGARIVPYGAVALDPAASALHYGQSIFEGMKAFRGPGGVPVLFRPRAHAGRLATSARRLVMPPLDPDLLVEGVRALVRTDLDWLPTSPGTALYVRPVMFATEAALGVRPARAYTLLAFLSPVGAYFSGPPRPLRIWVERERARAAPGGIGSAKTSANYVASLLAAEEAKARGFDQVLWLDGAEHRWLEEIGTMNVFVRLGDTIVTPPLTGTILPGVTRDAVLTLCRDLGLAAEERPVSLEELAAAHRGGALREVFGTGTAAVIAPIGELTWAQGAGQEAVTLALPAPGPESAGERLRSALLVIQRGEAPDRHGWLMQV